MRHSAHPVSGVARRQQRQWSTNAFTTGPLQWGVVHSVSSGAKKWVDLYLDGVTQRADFTATKTLTRKVRHLASVSPAVGDTVVVLRGSDVQNTVRIVIGVLA